MLFEREIIGLCGECDRSIRGFVQLDVHAETFRALLPDARNFIATGPFTEALREHAHQTATGGVLFHVTTYSKGMGTFTYYENTDEVMLRIDDRSDLIAKLLTDE